MDIVEALDAEEGICCVVGAGGKKTTLYALAKNIEKAIVTSTVRIPPFEQHVAELHVTRSPQSVIDDANRWPLGLVSAKEGSDRYRGYDPAIIESLRHPAVDTILVKADGARMRIFKAPNEREPQIPTCATTVVPIVSSHVIGKELSEEFVHRVGRVASLANIRPGAEITPSVVADIIAHPHGGLKAAPEGATVIPLVNMVDNDEYHSISKEIAIAIHARTDVPHVVLASMRKSDPIVEVI